MSRALFIYSPNVVDATIKLIVPDNWTVSTPWAEIEPGTWFADSWESLVSNALVVGPHSQRVIRDGNMTIVLAIDSALERWIDALEQTLTTQLHAYRTLFEGTPEARYLVALREADEIDGESFNDSFNQVVLPDGLSPERKVVWANVLGHELFHYWNGNNILVAENKSRVEWFGEGFTEYYSSLTLLRTGLIDEATYFKKLERYLARYYITRQQWPLDRVSLVDAGEDKHANWLLIYGGGATVALALDIEIRSLTQNARGLDDLMRCMKRRFGHGQRYETTDIFRCANDVSEADMGPFFEDYVSGTEASLDVGAYLEKAGLFVAQFSDEFYIHKLEHPTPAQADLYRGLVHSN